MAEAYHFRSAFNGFHREDVVHYIEYINTKHTAQLQQLQGDLEDTRQKLSQLQERPDLSNRVAELEEALAAARQELETVTAQRDEAIAHQVEVVRHNEAELEAYRRAERMERQSKERIEFLYQRATGVIADTAAKVDDTANHIAGIADQVVAQLSVLQSAVADSKQTLSGASAALCSIRVEE